MQKGHKKWFNFYEDDIRQSLEIEGSGTQSILINRKGMKAEKKEEEPLNNQVAKGMFQNLHKQIAEIDCQSLQTLVFSLNKYSFYLLTIFFYKH